MLEQLDALRALHETGTTRRAAVRLRISQSAVSKRIAALEGRIGVPLVEPDGRRVRLTVAGIRLLDDVLPHVRAIDERLRSPLAAVIRIAATESLLASWLPAALAGALATVAGTTLEIHAHRGPMALERLRAAEVDLAVLVTRGEDGLHVEPLGAEGMCIVPPRGDPDAECRLWTIEASSLTGAWLAQRLLRHSSIHVGPRIESFASALQLARAGFGHALVPVGLARAFGADYEPVPGLSRPIAVCVRPSAWERPVVRRFVHGLVQASARAGGGRLPDEDGLTSHAGESLGER